MDWQPIETAPRDRTRILAITGQIADERFAHWSNREFVVFYMGDLSGWALFPGMGCGDDWLKCWLPLPPPPYATKADSDGDDGA